MAARALALAAEKARAAALCLAPQSPPSLFRRGSCPRSLFPTPRASASASPFTPTSLSSLPPPHLPPSPVTMRPRIPLLLPIFPVGLQPPSLLRAPIRPRAPPLLPKPMTPGAPPFLRSRAPRAFSTGAKQSNLASSTGADCKVAASGTDATIADDSDCKMSASGTNASIADDSDFSRTDAEQDSGAHGDAGSVAGDLSRNGADCKLAASGTDATITDDSDFSPIDAGAAEQDEVAAEQDAGAHGDAGSVAGDLSRKGADCKLAASGTDATITDDSDFSPIDAGAAEQDEVAAEQDAGAHGDAGSVAGDLSRNGAPAGGDAGPSKTAGHKELLKELNKILAEHSEREEANNRVARRNQTFTILTGTLTQIIIVVLVTIGVGGPLIFDYMKRKVHEIVREDATRASIWYTIDSFFAYFGNKIASPVVMASRGVVVAGNKIHNVGVMVGGGVREVGVWLRLVESPTEAVVEEALVEDLTEDADEMSFLWWP